MARRVRRPARPGQSVVRTTACPGPSSQIPSPREGPRSTTSDGTVKSRKPVRRRDQRRLVVATHLVDHETASRCVRRKRFPGRPEDADRGCIPRLRRRPVRRARTAPRGPTVRPPDGLATGVSARSGVPHNARVSIRACWLARAFRVPDAAAPPAGARFPRASSSGPCVAFGTPRTSRKPRSVVARWDRGFAREPRAAYDG